MEATKPFSFTESERNRAQAEATGSEAEQILCLLAVREQS